MLFYIFLYFTYFIILLYVKYFYIYFHLYSNENQLILCIYNTLHFMCKNFIFIFSKTISFYFIS